MKVFKFGGASIQDAASMQNVGSIIQKHSQDIGLIVISALGKTTNALEKVIISFFEQQNPTAFQLLEEIKEKHLLLCTELGLSQAVVTELEDMFIDVEWILENPPLREFNYYYDQIICLGELLSSKIISEFLITQGIDNVWVDVRDVLRTDDNYRAANVNWAQTQQLVTQKISPLIGKKLVITQGFIGSTDDNCSTTLAREGSDYTAAIFSYCLNAAEMVIWKDVLGVLTADPRLFNDAVLLPNLSYEEAIEMTYYGAQVIHPKTLQPLQAKQIPLRVRSFIHQSHEGTLICKQTAPNNLLNLPPVVVVKPNQTLLKLESLDMEFMDEQKLAKVFQLLSKSQLKTNMSQHSALGFWVSVNTEADKLNVLKTILPPYFSLTVTEGLKLITLRHCSPDLIQKYIGNQTVLLQGNSQNTQQWLVISD
jgi:aspartate kinase